MTAAESEAGAGTGDEVAFVPRPAPISSAVAVILALLAVALVGDTSVQRRALALGAVGLVAFAVGAFVWRRDDSTAGAVAAVAGTVVVFVSVVLVATRPFLVVRRLELVPGMVGLWLLAAGLVRLYPGWERRLIAAGTGLVLVTVLTSGVVQTTDLGPLLFAGTLTIVAWDTADNAVSLGRQVGGDAETRRAEFTHGAASGLVAAGALLLVFGVNRLGVDGLPFAALAALLLAGVVLAVGHYR